MKFIISIIYLSIFLNIAFSSSIHNYVKTEVYQLEDNECLGDVVVTQYRVSGSCDTTGYRTLSCSLGSNTITIDSYDGTGCTGNYSTSTVDINSCLVNGKNYKYSCSADYEMGTNSLVSFLTNGSCPNSNPDWKSDIVQISYYNLNTCIQSVLGSTETTDCNSNSFTESLYLSSEKCTTSVWSHSVPFPECKEFQGTPSVMYCNK
ncbi:hypothetical protein DICPUDRAFT_25203 [Dictyostelium purpureum]|uniref:SUEL-type lectin domain-containing protein n=1 Tax=Dictyostelium purpureum TaxID=5786 RepID=F0Z6N0_DICPU|nr:uncharacterized protein DICPUDRAFT_25203 [Dictyostelium purpureum]EGC40385.1 hypothetical protein DICPUDRAFT_25203 [Dictyostelium purpureum]|eukprot:XP_003283136.1 hypothetical protein DICPUDRAFT_25203 [Dictyostelium purpureum]